MTPATMPTASLTLGAQIANVLRAWRFRIVDEYDLQFAVHATLRRTPWPAPIVREHRLTPHDRLDFLIGRVAIELKVTGPNSAVERQLRRYVAHPAIDEVVLVTTMTRHRALLRTDLPLHVVVLSGLA